jgi:DNA-binding protein HU-beta
MGYGRETLVNKAELIEALSGRLGDRKAATAALDAVLAEIQNAVTKGDKVSITGFGVFEKRVRAARTARNPRTGESVKVKKTSVPAFRPGASFKELVAAGKVPKVAKAAAPAKKTAAAPAKAAPAKAAKAVKTTTVKKAAPAKKVARAATSTPRSTTTVRTAAAKKAPARTARTAAK